MLLRGCLLLGLCASLFACDYDKVHKPSPKLGTLGAIERCDDPKLVWKTGAKTMYESYPAQGSEECVDFSGCEWEGEFAACEGKRTERWVAAHNIVSVFPDFEDLQLHDLCLRLGDQVIVATVIDECADSDCDGCCTDHRGDADQLIDVEKYTEARFGVLHNARIEWADLGPTKGTGCK